MSGIHLVWFKRDLRTEDHPPLLNATQQGRVLPLYVWETGLMQQPDFDAQHAAFIEESLQDLAQQLQALGASLQVAMGDIVDVLARIHASMPIAALYSHEETGNLWTFARDRAVARWCRQVGILWHQWRQDGVVRGLVSRDHWSDHWTSFFTPAPLLPPLRFSAVVLPSSCASMSRVRVDGVDKPLRQKGGGLRAKKLLDSFLDHRGLPYRYAMSSPNSAPKHCSRLSVHLAYGSLSMRQLLHRFKSIEQHWKTSPPAHPDREA